MSDDSRPRSRDPRTRVPEWFRTHRVLVDVLLALFIWLLTCSVFVIAFVDSPSPGQSSYPPATPDRALALLLVVSTLQTVPLVWRRLRPDLSFGLVLVGHLGQLVVTDTPLPSNLTALMSAYAVARYSTRRWVRLVALGTAAIGGILATRDWVGYGGGGLGADLMTSVFLSGLVLVCWLGGDLTRKRHEVVSRLREQNEALRRDRDQRARIVAQDERTRIAREMHDIVAHSLSVVVVQADGAAYTAAHSADFDRGQAQSALTTIGTTAREALAETRRLVGVLRTTEDEGGGPTGLGYTPTETLTDLPDLVARVAASGIDVTLDAPERLTSVPRETGLAAYRIVQESLTNVIKHAGPGVRVRIALTTGPDLLLEVRDDGRGAAATDDGHGHGLIGMRERAASVGGTMAAGPSPGGGYLVAASLPFAREETP